MILCFCVCFCVTSRRNYNSNMAKNKSNNNSIKGTKKKGDNNKADLNVINGIERKELAGFIFGMISLVLAVFLLIAFCSYLYTGYADFDLLERLKSGDLISEDYRFRNACGTLGARAAYFFLHETFGMASFLFIPFLIILGLRLMRVFRIHLVRKVILGLFMMIWTSVFLAFISDWIPGLQDSFLNIGGNHGRLVVRKITAMVGSPGLLGLMIITAVMYLVYVSAKTIELIRSMLRMNFIQKIRLKRRHNEEENDSDDEDEEESLSEDESEADASTQLALEFENVMKKNNVVEFGDLTSDIDKDDDEQEEQEAEKDNSVQLDITSGSEETIVEDAENNDDELEEDTYGPDFDVTATETEQGSGEIERGDINTPYDPKLDLESYQYPTMDLIASSEDSTPAIDMAEQNANKDRITHVLGNFGVEISSIKATIGPTITLYEIVPAEGTRISKIRNLEDDIALSLAAEGIRIIAPIPGKGTIGIEVPNKKKCVVSMESVLSSKAYQDSTMELPCAIGKTITNEVFMFDLAKAPHLLVAGATGQGKSVGLNAIIASLLYKKHPAELKIVMVDPKKVEFSIYSPIENHFLARLEEEEDCIITDVQKVVKTLTSLCQLMDTRYDMLKKAGCRNIKEYNAKFKERKLNPEHGHEFMPYIVVVVDEFGDLIMTAGKEVELPICRIAQLARAVGIHMIIATQRPQASIISGAIKTNFPARMAFKVSSMIDSRVVLDRPGAQQLIGRGDMLFLAGNEPVRVQCAFLDTPEVSNVCSFIAKQQGYLHPMYLPDVVVESDGDGMGGGSVDPKRLDPLFSEVAKFVVNSQQGSTSMIQRNYSIGYNRAGKIMDQLEHMGVVGAQSGSKPREVLIKDPLTLESLLNTLG